MSSLSLRLLVVVGLSAGLASTACTDQSSEEIDRAQEQKTEPVSERETEDVSGNQEPAPPLAVEQEEMPEEQRKELQKWVDEKLREAEENGEISEEKRKEYDGWLDEKLREAQEHEAEVERKGK